MVAIQKHAIYAVLLASTAHAFSPQSMLSMRKKRCIVPRANDAVLMMSYMDEMNRRGPPGGPMGGAPPGGRPGQQPPGMDRGPGAPPTNDVGGDMGGRGSDGGEPRNQHLDRHASDYLDELRAKRSGQGGSTIPTDPNQGRSFSANNPPGAFSVPNAGNTSGQQQRRDSMGRTGLGGLASGVSTPNDKYNFDGPPRSQRERGGYRGGPAGGPNQPMRGGGPSYNDRGGYGNNFGPGRGGEPSMGRDPMRGGAGGGGDPMRGPPPRNPRDMMSGPPPVGPLGPGPDPREMDILQMQDEIERLRTENAMLKRSAKDLMNNFNELSNRLFDVDETLKKVANVFPSEDELESLEWLLKK